MKKNLFIKIFASLFTIVIIVLGPLLTYVIYVVDKNNGSENDFITNAIGEWLDQYFNTLKFDVEKDYDYQITINQEVDNPIIWSSISNYDDSIGLAENVSNYLDGYLNNSEFEDEEGELHLINNIDISELGNYHVIFDFYYGGGSLSDNVDSENINKEEITFVYRFTFLNLFNNLFFRSIDDIVSVIEKDNEEDNIGEVNVKASESGRVEIFFDSESNTIDVTEYDNIDDESTKEHAIISINDEYKLNILTLFFFQFWIDDGMYSESFIENNYGARISSSKINTNWIRENGTWVNDWNTINSDNSVITVDGLKNSTKYLEGTRQTLSFSIMGTKIENQFISYIDSIYGYGKKGLVFVIKIIAYVSIAITSTILILIIGLIILLIIILGLKGYEKNKLEDKEKDTL